MEGLKFSFCTILSLLTSLATRANTSTSQNERGEQTLSPHVELHHRILREGFKKIFKKVLNFVLVKCGLIIGIGKFFSLIFFCKMV